MTFVSQQQKISDLEKKFDELEQKIDNWITPRKNNPQTHPVHSPPPEARTPRSKEQIIEDIKSVKVQ